MAVARITEKTDTKKDEPPQPLVSRRVRLAEALAFIGLVSAFIAAVGPAEPARATYAWPPRELPAEEPRSLWYAPLLLSSRVPDSLTASIPCRPGPALAGASEPHTILATAREAERLGGFAAVRDANHLLVAVGDRQLARVPLAQAGSDTNCAYRFGIREGRWTLDGGSPVVSLRGSLGFMPVVNGFFSQLDLRSPRPEIEVTTRPHATDPSRLQLLGWIIAGLCTLSALWLVAFERRPRRPPVANALRRAMRATRPADAVVGLSLLSWWLLAPTTWDDGWVLARQRSYSVSGGFSNYYDSVGVNLPNGYWLEWLQHWVSQSSTSLLILRLPSLVCLVAMWVIVRWIVARAIPSPARSSSVSLWALTSAFLVGAMAWGMILRPEPVTALLITAAFACVVRFVERGATAPLALAAAIVPLALTGHHAGALVLAPLLAAGSPIVRWVRANFPAAVALATSMFASLLLLAFVDSDLGRRAADARAIREHGLSHGWYDEFYRYARLSDFSGGAPLRRASVALILLAVVAYALRRRRSSQGTVDLAPRALALALVLLFALPSKWPWHFGALIGVAAIAVTAETWRVRGDDNGTGAWSLRSVVMLGAATLAIGWAWGPREPWSILDLRTLDWKPGFESLVPLTILAALVPIAVALLGALSARIRREPGREIPYRTVTLIAPMIAVPLIVFTAAMLVVDTAQTNGWTLRRQNLAAVFGDAGCGLASDITVPADSSVRSLEALGNASQGPLGSWVPPPPVPGLPRLALGPGGASSPWFRVPTKEPVGVFVAGAPSSGAYLTIDWGVANGDRDVALLDRRVLPIEFDPDVGAVTGWTFANLRSVDVPGANALRVHRQARGGPNAAVALTAPLGYSRESLEAVLRREHPITLVSPGLLPYFPCVRQPRLAAGVAEIPDYFLAVTSTKVPLGYTTSPFWGLHDVYGTTKLAWSEAHGATPHVALYRVDKSIPDAARTPVTTGSEDAGSEALG